MPEMTLLDRAADALRIANWGRDFDPKYTWAGVTEGHKNVWRAQALVVARVILEEPASEGMVWAGQDLEPPRWFNKVWAAMAKQRLADLAGRGGGEVTMDRPIIFSGPMARALFDGRKTQTRRLAWKRVRVEGPDKTWTGDDHCNPSPWQKVKPGDRLWVRESVAIEEGGRWLPNAKVGRVHYRADEGAPPAIPRQHGFRSGKWTPSIHMPRWASRLTLTVTAVKVERLQEISEEDAKAEGVKEALGEWIDAGFGLVKAETAPARTLFALLWQRLHGADAWESNPEVVAIIFKAEKRNIDALAPT